VKFKQREIRRKSHKIPERRYEDPRHISLTSFAGLIIFQALFQRWRLRQRLTRCFGHLRSSASYPTASIVHWLITHLLLGYRKLRDRDYYAEDPLVQRVLGLTRLPDVATISRTLAAMDETAVVGYQQLNRQLVLERLQQERLARVTLDFDGSVLSTARHAEGTAIGFNKKKKGARSYYPLFCTVAQTAQILDLAHRSGNVHDSNGSQPFIRRCVESVRSHLPQAALEARLDSAFFDEGQLVNLALQGVQFTVSVPFERFPKLKGIIESRRHWRRIDDTWSYFECDWKPEKWWAGFRMVVIRQKKAEPTKGPLQLDLFEPKSHVYEYQVIVTNKTQRARPVMEFHHGRGAQEGVFAEAKTHCQMEYIPVRTWCGNQVYCLSAVLAHNLSRELQMQASERAYATQPNRRNLWGFETLGVLRQRLIRRAGRLIRPQGRLTLVLSGNERVQAEIEHYLTL
jgi:hypothetical protein